MTTALVLKGRPSGAQLADLREQILDVEEEIGVLRDEALTLCEHVIPEAQFVHRAFALLGPDFHAVEQMAANVVGRLEGYRRRFHADESIVDAEALAA